MIAKEKGDTVNGKPLEEYLDQERTKEIHQDRLEAERSVKRAIHIRERMPESTKRVAKRVTRLSDLQIRREYGVMKKPYQNMEENILAIIFEYAPVNVNDIKEKLGAENSTPSISGMVSHIWKKAGDTGGLLVRQKSPGKNASFVYDVSPEARKLTSEEAVAFYRQLRPKKQEEVEVVEEKKEEPATTPLPSIPSEINININISVTGGLELLIFKLLGK